MNENVPIIYSNIFSLTAGPIEASVWYLSIEQLDSKQDVCYNGPDTDYPCFCPDGMFCCQYDTCVDIHCCPYNFICSKEENSPNYNSCTNGKHILNFTYYYRRELYIYLFVITYLLNNNNIYRNKFSIDFFMSILNNPFYVNRFHTNNHGTHNNNHW